MEHSQALPANPPKDRLAAFFAVTFTITWGIGLVLMLFPGVLGAADADAAVFHPLFVLAVAGPTLAALLLTGVTRGGAGLRQLLGMLFRWRFGLRWYVFLLVGIPLAGYALAQVAGPEPALEIGSPGMLLAVLGILLITGPLGEELGWRGYALPRLLDRSSPLLASLVLGVIWGVWHLPAFFVAGLPQEGLAIPVFLLMSLGLSVLATWVFLRTGRSVLAVVLFHYTVNLSLSVLGTPLAALTLASLLGAALVVALDRRVGWFRRGAPLAEETASRQVVYGVPV
jgi:uncharacterized protein